MHHFIVVLSERAFCDTKRSILFVIGVIFQFLSFYIFANFKFLFSFPRLPIVSLVEIILFLSIVANFSLYHVQLRLHSLENVSFIIYAFLVLVSVVSVLVVVGVHARVVFSYCVSCVLDV